MGVTNRMKLENLHEAKYQPTNLTEEAVVRTIVEWIFQNLTEEEVKGQKAWQMSDFRAIRQALLIKAKHEYKLYSGFNYELVNKMVDEVAKQRS